MKRRWFQIHLSTAIVMMCLAGMFLYPNLVITTCESVQPSKIEGFASYKCEAFVGWPWPFRLSGESGTNKLRYVRENVIEFRTQWNVQKIISIADANDFAKEVFWNLLSSMFLLLSAAFILELFIRRREARKP